MRNCSFKSSVAFLTINLPLTPLSLRLPFVYACVCCPVYFCMHYRLTAQNYSKPTKRATQLALNSKQAHQEAILSDAFSPP